MRGGLLILLALIWVAGCAQHSSAWDDAWAQCDAEASEQAEFAQPDPDQRSEWQENYIRECMDKKGLQGESYHLNRPSWAWLRGRQLHGDLQCAFRDAWRRSDGG